MSTPGPARLIGRYLLFGEIAAGGMATVHFGRLSGVGGFSRTVAIKRLHPQYAQDPEFVAMFLDEARLAARIRHPNVVPTLDVIANEGELFLVLEYVQGESLARLLRSVRGMMTFADTRVLATIMAGVLHGLNAAHEAVSEQGEPLNIVHRDVSPQNILVGVDGVARLLDFGVARAAGRLQTTRQGQLKGKIPYMSPEQLHNLPVTRQSDAYSAAVVAWEAMTGQRLFVGDNQAALAASVLRDPVRPPSQMAPHVPLSIDRVIMRGLERDPARRYASAREMALDLERSAGVAPASEVGAWVESLARDELSRRAIRIAEIESASSSVSSRRTFANPEDMPTIATSNPVIASLELANLTDESSIVVAPPIIAKLPRSTQRRVTLWAAAAAGVLLAALAALHLSRGGDAERTSATSVAPRSNIGSAADTLAPPTPPVAAWETAADVAPPPATATATSEPQTVSVFALPVASAPPSSSPPPSRPRRFSPPIRPRPLTRPVGGGAPTDKPGDKPADKPATAATTPNPDCDPPFTLDERGHKHYKPACL
jgi:eukaryotic-like serine/threonine-protein kinase